jgi:hypothetical protein
MKRYEDNIIINEPIVTVIGYVLIKMEFTLWALSPLVYEKSPLRMDIFHHWAMHISSLMVKKSIHYDYLFSSRS